MAGRVMTSVCCSQRKLYRNVKVTNRKKHKVFYVDSNYFLFTQKLSKCRHKHGQDVRLLFCLQQEVKHTKVYFYGTFKQQDKNPPKKTGCI